MTIIYIVLACLLIGLCIVFYFRSSGPSRPGPAADIAPEEVETAHEDFPEVFADEEKAAVREAYPVLQAIPYVIPAEGIYPLSSPMVDNHIKTMLLSKISILPVGTPSLSLLNLLQKPESNAREVTSLVSTNPSFSAKVLQAANSVYFHQTEKVTSIGRAITLLGYSNVRALILDDLLSSSIPAVRDRDRESYMRIWTHSAVVSAVAGHIGKLFRLPEYTLGTVGLLHDIGKFFLETIFRPDGSAEGLTGVIREDRQYGINHAVIGAIIADQWQLPRIITDSIEHHHSPCFVTPEHVPEAARKYSVVICLADLISNIMGIGSGDAEYLPLRREYNEMSGFTGDISDYITPELIMDIEKARQTVQSYTKAP